VNLIQHLLEVSMNGNRYPFLALALPVVNPSAIVLSAD
jgi:hypothetical protein